MHGEYQNLEPSRKNFQTQFIRKVDARLQRPFGWLFLATALVYNTMQDKAIGSECLNTDKAEMINFGHTCHRVMNNEYRLSQHWARTFLMITM